MSSTGPYGSSPYGSRPSADDPYGTQPYPEPEGYGYGQNPYQSYGQPSQLPAQHQPYLMPMAPAQRTNGLAIASLITSCTGLFLGISAPVGIVLGIIAMSQIKSDPGYTGRGMALAGIVVGGALTVIGALLIVAFLAFALGTTPY